ncbi:addiction module protein [Methylomagnum sp.]
MNAILKSFGIDQLSVEDQISLVEEIWDNVAANSAESLSLPDSQKAELDRRLADCDANPDDGIPWDEVKAAALANLKR